MEAYVNIDQTFKPRVNGKQIRQKWKHGGQMPTLRKKSVNYQINVNLKEECEHGAVMSTSRAKIV